MPNRPPLGPGAGPPPGGRPPPTRHERRTLAEPPRPSAGLFGPAPIAPVRALGLLAVLVGATGLALAVGSRMPAKRPAVELPTACAQTVEQRFYVAPSAAPFPPGNAAGAPDAAALVVGGAAVAPPGSRLVCAEHLQLPAEVSLAAGDAWVQGEDGAWRHHPGGMAAPLRLLLDLPLPLNRVGAAELALLAGLNSRQARAIVAHRGRCGPFSSVDELLRVHGVGKKTLARVRCRLTVDALGGDDVGDGGTAQGAAAPNAGGSVTRQTSVRRDGAGASTQDGGPVERSSSSSSSNDGQRPADASRAATGTAASQVAEVPPPPAEPEVHPLDAPLPDSPLATPPSYGRGLDARRAWLVEVVRHLPQASLSRAWGWLARLQRPRFLVRAYQRAFVRAVGIDMAESEYPLTHYPSLQALFCRRLRAGARPLDPAPEAILSPVDARIGQCGIVTRGTMLQVKGRSYSLARLLGDADRAARFEGGPYATLYLAPRDYHRIHAPLGGAVHEAKLIRGSLLPVFEESLHKIDELFARNERIVTYLRAEDAAGHAAGELAVVKVAATLVGSLRTSYDGALRGNVAGAASRTAHYDPPAHLLRGAELGTFELGSTVVLVGERGRLSFAPLEFGERVRVGERIGTVSAAAGATLPQGAPPPVPG